MFARLLLLACALSLVSLESAHAQAMNGVEKLGPIVGGSGRARTSKPAPPPALPGAALGGDRQVPADRTEMDLPPTDALFDAINRGDIAAARDALNRGADINAHNVLGLTPIDEAVDLSRNDIAFLLMSLRGASPASGGGPSTQVAGQTAPSAKDAAPTRHPPARQAETRPAPAPRPVMQVEQRLPAQGPTGTPNPQTGFLGFGS